VRLEAGGGSFCLENYNYRVEDCMLLILLIHARTFSDTETIIKRN